jgi:hypothetical protein
MRVLKRNTSHQSAEAVIVILVSGVVLDPLKRMFDLFAIQATLPGLKVTSLTGHESSNALTYTKTFRITGEHVVVCLLRLVSTGRCGFSIFVFSDRSKEVGPVFRLQQVEDDFGIPPGTPRNRKVVIVVASFFRDSLLKIRIGLIIFQPLL